jgi:hypothetical protein
MPFQKGQSGNPHGRGVEKVWRDAVMLAVNEKDGKGKDARKKLRRLAEALVDAGLGGDISAIREIGDRLDGKPAQIVGGDENGGPIRHSVTVEFVKPDA